MKKKKNMHTSINTRIASSARYGQITVLNDFSTINKSEWFSLNFSAPKNGIGTDFLLNPSCGGIAQNIYPKYI